MKRIHIIKTELDPEQIGALVATAAGLDLRIGWLVWAPESEGPGHVEDPPLGDAAKLGVLRAVAVERGRTVAVKPMAGPPVFRDVLREHFRGCAAVVTRVGASADLPRELRDAPCLDHDGGAFVVSWEGTEGEPGKLRLTAEDLAKRLRRPRPF